MFWPQSKGCSMVLLDSSIEMTNFTIDFLIYSYKLFWEPKENALNIYFLASVTCGNVHKHVYPELNREMFLQFWVNELCEFSFLNPIVTDGRWIKLSYTKLLNFLELKWYIQSKAYSVIQSRSDKVVK